MIYKTFHFKTLLYLLPAVFIFLTFNVIPGLTSLVLSFFDFTGFETNLFRNFVGIDNFIKIYEVKYFWIALKNTFLFDYINNSLTILISVLFITLLLGVISAYFISFYEFPLCNFFSWALILAFAIPGYIFAFSIIAFFENYGTAYTLSLIHI